MLNDVQNNVKITYKTALNFVFWMNFGQKKERIKNYFLCQEMHAIYVNNLSRPSILNIIFLLLIHIQALSGGHPKRMHRNA